MGCDILRVISGVITRFQNLSASDFKMLNKHERDQLRHLTSSPQWDTLLRLKDLYVKEINDRHTIGDSQWDTTKQALEKEYEVQGITRFLQRILEETNKDD